jgi:hypothetical membrane protein
VAPVAGIAGIVGPALFFVVLVIEGATRPGYSTFRDTISELSLGPRGWIQISNFLIFGVLFIVFSRGVRTAVADSRAARIGSALLTTIGAGVTGCGLFRAEPWPPLSMSPAGLLHLVCAMALVFGLLPVATAALARAFAADARWRTLAPVTVLTSIVTLLLFIGGLAVIGSPARPSRIAREYIGLIQRIDVAIFLAWQVGVGIRLAGGTRAQRSRRHSV